MKAFPLQHKKMQRLTQPYMQIGTCEVMNLASTYNMDSFNFLNRKNVTFYEHDRAATLPFLGEVLGGGLLDSYAGRDASSFVGQYLARALSTHTIVPAELRALRKEDPENPLWDVMMTGLRRRHSMGADLQSLLTEWDFHQYAMCADASFFSACRAGGQLSSSSAYPPAERSVGPNVEVSHGAAGSGEDPVQLLPEEMGCRGVWFSAAVIPTAIDAQQRRALVERKQHLAPPPQKMLPAAEAAEEAYTAQLLAQTPFCLDVTVGGLGNSRAFGVARNVLTDGTRSLLDLSRERTVPLSTDHTPMRSTEYRRIIQAGGKVDSAVGDIIDGNPFMNVSRSFGHWSMKCNAQRSPVEQKMIALPSVRPWRMLGGDVLVLCNHAVFETRHEEDTSMDELAKVVGRGLDAKQPAEAIAAAVCDFAVRFGAEHSLQVMIAIAQTPTANEDAVTTSAEADGPAFAEWIEPGPLYVGACSQFPPLYSALELDCARCGVTVAELVRLRWQRVRALLPLRHSLSLLPYYGKECGALQQVMEEEAAFFEQAGSGVSMEGAAADAGDAAVFETLARRLQPSKRGQ